MSSKKRKRSENAEAERSQENGEAHSLAGSTTTKTSKSKQAKGRKRQREDELKPESTQLLGKYEQKSKATDRTSDVTPSDAVPEQDYDHTMTPDTSQKSQRFIVFIGNLPYSATTDSINAHFSKLRPRSVRHQTDKETGQSRGFAFLEFDGYDRMKTCLKLYHHSSFEDGLSNARRINVELTAGGGGSKSKKRKSKLKEKNRKLEEERARRDQYQKGKKVAQGGDEETLAPGHSDDIHPSRRNRVAQG